MACGCGIDADYGEPIKKLKRNIIASKEPHVCDECSKIIEPGEEHEEVTGISEGKPFAFFTCSDCQSLRVFFCGSAVLGGLRSEIETFILEEQGNISEDCIAALKPAARDWVFETIEAAWADSEATEFETF